MKTVIENMTMERLHELVKSNPGGVFITDIEQVDDTYSVTLSDSCDVEILQDMAFKDYLTNVYNRRYFVEQLDNRIAEFRRHENHFGIVMLDLDDFTSINNTYGHEAGDTVIQHTAQVLTEHFRRKSDIVARLGGDEFIVLIGDVGDAEWPEEVCAATCEPLMDDISLPIDIGSHIINVTASVGAAFTENDDDHTDPHELAKELLRHADKAMYEAKEKGKNTYSIYSKNKNYKGDTDVYKTNGSDR